MSLLGSALALWLAVCCKGAGRSEPQHIEQILCRQKPVVVSNIDMRNVHTESKTFNGFPGRRWGAALHWQYIDLYGWGPLGDIQETRNFAQVWFSYSQLLLNRKHRSGKDIYNSNAWRMEVGNVRGCQAGFGFTDKTDSCIENWCFSKDPARQLLPLRINCQRYPA